MLHEDRVFRGGVNVGAYEVGPWADFAVAVAGATAALTGLLFVAVSVNIREILQYANLPARAAYTLIMLATPLLGSIVLLIPDQPRRLLGLELIVLGLVGGPLLAMNRPGTKTQAETWPTFLTSRFVPSLLTPAFFVLAGIGVIAEAGGGLYWLAPAVIVAIVAGLGNAWVLLVEILR